jgi:hypothetical protein
MSIPAENSVSGPLQYKVWGGYPLHDDFDVDAHYSSAAAPAGCRVSYDAHGQSGTNKIPVTGEGIANLAHRGQRVRSLLNS